MKVLFLIYSHGPATGGHFHSLDTISRNLGSSMTVKIASIGTNPSPVLQANPFYATHIRYAGVPGYFSFLRNLRKYTREFNPDVVHCFDGASLTLTAPFLAYSSYKVVMNKCGGPNPVMRHWLWCSSLVFFSLENFNWFNANEFYRNSKLFLIPNRVETIGFLPEADRSPAKDTSQFNLVRITRIGPYYWHTMQLAVRAAAFIGKIVPCRLYIIGRVYDENILKQLKDYANEHAVDLVLVNDTRANKAVKMLYLADAVIGTGRSVMEAMSFGLTVLAPALESELPVLLNAENFSRFFEQNFSERVISDEAMRNQNQKNLEVFCNSDEVRKQAGMFSQQMFDLHFNIVHASGKYEAVYKSTNTEANRQLLSRNLKYVIKDIVNLGKRKG